MTRISMFTAVLGVACVACVGQPPTNDPTTPGANPNDPSTPGDPNDPGGDPTDPTGGGATPAAVLERISTTECDQAFTCKDSFPTQYGAFADYFGASATECYAINAEYWNAGAVEAGIQAGTITFDATAADACLAGAIEAPVCTTFWEQGPGVPDACWDAFAGTVAQGGACQIDFECAAELVCGQAGTCAANTGQ